MSILRNFSLIVTSTKIQQELMMWVETIKCTSTDNTHIFEMISNVPSFNFFKPQPFLHSILWL